MNLRLRINSHALMRAGLITTLAGALLYGVGDPAFAAENDGATSSPIVATAPASQHPQAAKNVTATVQGTTVTVTWERAEGFTNEYKVSLKEGRSPRIVRYSRGSSVAFTAPQVEEGHTYYVVVEAMDRYNTLEIQGSAVMTEQFVVPVTATPPAGSGENETPGSGQGGGSSSETQQPPVIEAPGVPKTVSARLLKGDSTAIEAFWFAHDPKAPVSAYEVKLTGSDSSSTVKTLVMESNNTLERMTFTNLTPGVTYKVEVRAQNAGGWSDWSTQSTGVTIPGNQNAFKMQIDKEGFGVFVHPNRDVATVSWAKTGFEPEHSYYIIRIKCLHACGEKNVQHDPARTQVHNRIEYFDAHGPATNWKLERLPQAVYQAEIKLAHGAQFSEIAVSEPFTIGTPVEVANPKLTVTPSTPIDPSKSVTLTVNGTGYLGDGAINGTYVIVTEPSVWTPGTVPVNSKQFVHSTWVMPQQIRNGAFSVQITLPEGTLTAGKTYFVGTMASHALSMTDRSLDQRVDLTLASQGTTEPQPGDNQSGNTQSGDNQSGNTQSGDNQGGTSQDGTSQPAEPSVTPTVSDKPMSSFVAGEAVVLDLAFANAAEGSVWNVSLHSDPVDLGSVTVRNGRAKLEISAEKAAKFVAGAHTLKFVEVGVQAPRTISLPWTVVAKQTPPAQPSEPSKPSTPVPGKDTSAQAGDKGQQMHKPTDVQKPTSPAQTPAPQAKTSTAPQALARTGADASAAGLMGLAMLVAGAMIMRSRKRH